MAVAFNGVSHGNFGSASNVTFSHNAGTGSDRLIVVGTMTDSNSRTVTTCTYNGVGLTQAGSLGGSGYTTELWYLVAPSTGSNSVSVAWSGTGVISAGAISFTGVDQSTPVSGYQSSSGTASTRSVTITSKVGDMCIDTIASFFPATSSQTFRYNTSSFDEHNGATAAGAASVVMSYTLTLSGAANISGMNINQVSTRRIFTVT